MNVVGMVRVRNGETHITRCLHSMLRACNSIVVMDDHSTDRTQEMLDSHAPHVQWFKSPFQGLNEARDKTFLLRTITRGRNYKGPVDWVVAMDADEVLLDPLELRHCLESTEAPALSRRILTLWDSPNQIRTDGIYGNLWRPSIFRPAMTDGIWHQASSHGPNFHCGSVPTDLLSQAVNCDPEVRVLHYGSMLQEDRVTKYRWYMRYDTQNLENEDHYRHAVQGDLPEFPATEVYKHGGPLKLEEWHV